MVLPEGLHRTLAPVLGAEPTDVRALGGGDISRAARISAGAHQYLVKWHPHPPVAPEGWPPMFEAEAMGLRLLAEAAQVRVPRVVAHAEEASGYPTYIVLEWIDSDAGSSSSVAGARLGHQLAAQHRCSSDSYGLGHNNYCGATPQCNSQHRSWIEFYGQERLAYQVELAAQRGRMPTRRHRLLDRLIERLDDYIDESACAPGLLHGDLWGGNWMVGRADEPIIIDPAVYYGDREAELAMCRLFGGFPASFYDAYDEAWPPAAGRDDRIALYKLYHVLNHLNLFGESYGSQVDTLAGWYVG